MAVQYSDAVRNAQADALETTVGTAPTLELRSGSPPANCATADSGTLIASMTLPSDWLAAASGGSKSKLGTWSDPSADNAGTLGHFRIKAGATCHMQGTVTLTGGGGDMTVDNTSVQATQAITITSFSVARGNG